MSEWWSFCGGVIVWGLACYLFGRAHERHSAFKCIGQWVAYWHRKVTGAEDNAK